MKTKIVLFVLLIGSSLLAFSQENKKSDFQQRREEIKAQRVAFITDKVGFTPDEAQKFWPLYNELGEKKRQVNSEVRKLRKANKEVENPDYAAMNEANMNARIKEAELDKEYYLKFKQILPAEKIYKLYKAEKDFQKELLGRLQNK